MGRTANPYTRVTEVASFVNSSWKEYWYKSIEKGTKENPIGLIESTANECVEFSKAKRTPAEWKEFLSARTALGEADRIGRESTDFGKGVHAIAEGFLLDRPVVKEWVDDAGIAHPLTERQHFSGGLITNWCKEAKVKPLIVTGVTGIQMPAIELELVSEQYKLTGHPDLINTFGDDKTVWVTDWKTSKECRIEYILQLAAYAQMMFEKYGVDIQNGAIIRTPSDPNTFPQFETHTFTNLRSKYFPLFLEAKNVMDFFKNKGQWKGTMKKAA